MARRNKLWRFAQLQTYPNYYEAALGGPAKPGVDVGHSVVGASGTPVDMRNRWASDHFGNDRPITLELACGRGEYTLALAQAHRNRSFIGVDIKGARIYLGATVAKDELIVNAAFLRTRIEQLDQLFGVAEIDEIWITFPDPFLKSGSVNRRLTSPRFWTSYAHVLKPGGRVHLKTDDDTLYEYSKEVSPDIEHFKLVADVPDIYASDVLPHPELAHKTYYEGKNISNTNAIKWLSWERNL